MWKNFIPDEPTSRSLGVVEPNWLKDRLKFIPTNARKVWVYRKYLIGCMVYYSKE